MQNITVSGHAVTYPITRIEGSDSITTIDIAIPNPRRADEPIIYRVEC